MEATLAAQTAIRVFLVDDHRATLWGLERLIGSTDNMRHIGSATSLPELMASPCFHEADVIVLDLDFGGHDCTDALADLIRAQKARVLVLTGSREDEAHRRALLAGARGVVRKEESVDVLLRAIEKVHEGEVWVNRALLGNLMTSLVGGGQVNNEESGKIASLTPKEHDVVAAVLRHKGAKSFVLAEELRISEHTLRNHLSVIYQKLGVRGRLELYLYAKEHKLGATT